MSRAAAPRATTARWVLAVALVLGVLGMHALMGPPAAPGAGETMAMAVAMEPAGSSPDAAPALSATVAAPGGGHGSPVDGHAPAGGHSMLTTCLAVLGALASVLLLAAAARRWADLAPTAARAGVALRRSLGRPPPWTIPSLHQLSLLRV